MKQFNNETIYNLFRGLTPWPGIWTILPNGKRLKITKMTMKQFNNLTIDSVQLEGKKEVDFGTFNKAYKDFF
jgi:methionyl-tRNA formyltransferase